MASSRSTLISAWNKPLTGEGEKSVVPLLSKKLIGKGSHNKYLPVLVTLSCNWIMYWTIKLSIAVM